VHRYGHCGLRGKCASGRRGDLDAPEVFEVARIELQQDRRAMRLCRVDYSKR
jgi:hypothetical protein